MNLAMISGSPVDSYCANATSVRVDAGPMICGSAMHPNDRLTSLDSAQQNCYGVPLRFDFSTAVSRVDVEFNAGAQDFDLLAYDTNDGYLGMTTETSLFDCNPSVVSYTSTASDIKWVTFGKKLSTAGVAKITYWP